MLKGSYVVGLCCDEMECVARKRELTRLDPSGMTFEGAASTECIKQARKAGWVLHRDGRCTCPWCAGKGIGERGQDGRAAGVVR